MWALETLCEPLWQRLTWTLLHFLWQGLAVAALAATLLRVWPVRRARNRYVICLLALVAMAACPLVTFVLTEVPESVTAGRDQAEPQFEVSAASEPEIEPVANETRVQSRGPAAVEPPPALARSETPPPLPAESPGLGSPEVEAPADVSEPATWRTRLRHGVGVIQPYALVIWIAGVLALAVRLSISWLHVRWLAWGRLAISADLAEKATAFGCRLGLRFPPRVCVSEKIREAIVVGLWRPLVLLPASWPTEMTPEVLEAVIAHELAHIRRWDLWVNLLQRLVEMFLFYHPAVWWLSRRVGLEREMCTDELAVGVTNKRMAYATALEQLGLMRLGQSTPQLGASVGDRKMVLLNRVGNILGLSASDKKARWWPVALTALAVPLTIWLASTGIVSSTGNETAADEVADASADPRKDDSPGNLQAKLSAGLFRDGRQWLCVLVHNSSEDEWAYLEPGVCPPEILVDGVAYRSTRTEKGMYATRPRTLPPRSRDTVAEFTLHEQWVTVEGAKPLQLTPDSHSVRAIVYGTDRDTGKRGPKVLSSAIEIGADGRAIGSREVRIRILGGEKKKPLAGLELTVGCYDVDSKLRLTATTEDDGSASFRLAQGSHVVRFTSPRELPYLPFNTNPYRPNLRTIHVDETQGKQTFELVLADPCELVLRAVDADTGEGIPDVRFALENPAGEIWSQPVVNETILPPSKQRYRYDANDKSLVTDKDGYFRRKVGPRHHQWTYWVEVWPDGYVPVLRGGGKAKIDTSLGKKRAEHTFLFRRKGAQSTTLEKRPPKIAAPEGWNAVQTKSPMIQAEFALPKAEGDEVDGRLTVMMAGGSIDANVQRWRRQFQELEDKRVEEIDVSGTKVTLADFSGTFKAQPGRGPVTKRPGYRVLAAIISRPDSLLFVKGYGPARTMARHEDTFRTFVESLASHPEVTPSGNLRVTLSASLFREGQQWLRVFVNNCSEDEWGCLEPGVCPPEILVDGVAYRSTRTEAGMYAERPRDFSPRSGRPVAEFTLHDQWMTVDDAKPLQLTSETHTVRAILYRTDRDTGKRGPRILTNAIELGADGRAVGSRDVRIRILGGEQKKPLAGLELSVSYGILGGQNVLTATTDNDGGASFQLTQGTHIVTFTSPKEFPFLPFSMPDSYRPNRRTIYVHKTPDKQVYDLVLADPCELVLRAVDVDTGEGIPGVRFALENAAGEIWSQPIASETIRPPSKPRFPRYDPNDKSQVTDKDGYFRRLVGPRHDGWIYWVEVWPDGYRLADRGQAKIDTSLGTKKAEHTFLGRRNWGKPIDGLRCRWVPSSLPVSVGSKPGLSFWVKNVSEEPLFWEALSEITLHFHPWGFEGGATLPKFEIRTGSKTRLATAREVREQYGVGRPDRHGDDPMDGYYHFEPGGILRVTTQLPWTLDKAGKHKVWVSFARRHTSGSKEYPLSETQIRCPPIVLNAEDWGDPVRGVKMRLHASTSRWTQGRMPELRVDFVNLNNQNLGRLAFLNENWAIELDGRLYRVRRPDPGGTDSAFRSGTTRKNVPVPLHADFIWTDGSSLEFTPGKHTVRIHFTHNETVKVNGRYAEIQLVSNPLEIEIAAEKPGRDAFGAVITEQPSKATTYLDLDTGKLLKASTTEVDKTFWGPAVEGVQIRVLAKPLPFHEDEAPIFRVDVRNRGTRDLLMWTIPVNGWEIEVDGQWYRPDLRNTLLPQVLSAGGEYKNLELKFETRWQDRPVWVRTDDERISLQWPPGKHTVRLAVLAHDPKDRDTPSIRAETNPIEIEIVAKKPPREATESSEAGGPSEKPAVPPARFGPVMQRIIWIGASDSFMLDLDTGKTQGKPKAPETGRGMDIWPDRDEAEVGPYDVVCRGVKGVVVSSDQWDVTPAELIRTLSDPNLKDLPKITHNSKEVTTAFVKTSEGGMGVLKLHGAIAAGDLPDRPVIFYRMLVDVRPKAGWGPPADGVQARLRATKRTWKAGEPPSLEVDLENTGSRPLSFPRNYAFWHLQVDGRWHVHRLGGGSELPNLFGGDHYEKLPLSFAGDWRLAEKEEIGPNYRSGFHTRIPDDRPRLKLAAGKHTVRVAVTAESARASTGGPLWVESNPVEIEIVADKPPANAEKATASSAETNVPGPPDSPRDPKALLQQLNSGTLSDERIRQITDKALAVQGDLKQEWDPAWGNWLEVARIQGKVSHVDFERYAKQSNPVWKFEANEAMDKRSGKFGLSFSLRHIGGRVASKTSNHGLIITYRLVRVRVKDVPIDWRGSTGKWTFTAKTGHGSGIFREPHEIKGIRKLIPGKHEAVLLIEGEVYEADHPEKILHRWNATLKDEIELHELLMPWGPAVQGVQVRLRSEKRVWRADEVPVLIADIRNQGKRDLTVQRRVSPAFALEVDGKWHAPVAWDPVVHSPFGPRQEYRDIEVQPDKFSTRAREIDDRIQLYALRPKVFDSPKTPEDEPLRLSPGKHWIRVALRAQGKILGDFIVPPLSNPIEIEVVADRPTADDEKATAPLVEVYRKHAANLVLPLEVPKAPPKERIPYPTSQTWLKDHLAGAVPYLLETLIKYREQSNRIPAVGDLLFEGWKQGLLTDGQQQTLIESHLSPAWEMREAYPPGYVGEIMVMFDGVLVEKDAEMNSSSVRRPWPFRPEGLLKAEWRIELDGKEIRRGETGGNDGYPLQLPADLKPGNHQLKAFLEVSERASPWRHRWTRSRELRIDPELKSESIVADRENSSHDKAEALPAGDPRREAKVELVLDRKEYFLGENVLLHYGVRNSGSAPFNIHFGHDYRGSPRALRFKVVATGPDGQPVADPYPSVVNMGGMGGERTLEPGEVFWTSLPLMRYCDFDRPGTHKIRVYHDLGWDISDVATRYETMLTNALPKGAHLAPIVEATIKLALPTPEQAQRLVAEMLALPTDANATWGKQTRPYQDVTTLRHPVYLPIVEKLARQGNHAAATAVGAIATPEATTALVRLSDCDDQAIAAEALKLLLKRLPDPALEMSAFAATTKRLVERSWRDDMKPEVIEIGWQLLAKQDRTSLIQGAKVIRCLGEKRDWPRFAKELDRVLDQMKDDPTEQNAYPRPLNASGDMIRAGWQLIERGAAVPTDPQTPGQAAMFMQALGRRAEFRPAGWQTVAGQLLRHPIPYVRSVAVENLMIGKLPVESLHESILPLLKDRHLAVSARACDLAATSKSDRYRDSLRDVLREADDEWLLRAAHRAALACGVGQDQVLEICIDQLGRPRAPDSRMHTAVFDLMIQVVEREGGHGYSHTDWSVADELQARWRKLLEANREQIRAGRRFKIGQPPLTPDLFPRGFRFQRKDGPGWPDWSDNAQGSAQRPARLGRLIS